MGLQVFPAGHGARRGKPSAIAGAKDVLLYLLSRSHETDFLSRSVEWCGDWVEALSLDGASTIASMVVELGAMCVFLPPGPGRSLAGLQEIVPSAEAVGQTFELDVDGLPPFVAKPDSPRNAVPIDECAGQAIDYVFIGSCTNSRLSDLAEVAKVLEGREYRHPCIAW